MQEIVYVNNGELYKESEAPMCGESRVFNSHFVGTKSDGVKEIVSNYYNHANPIPSVYYDWFGVKTDTNSGESKVKIYHKSEYYAKQTGGTNWYDTSNIDVCPSIGNILSIGVIDNEIDLFFDIKDADNMQDVSDYYKLPPPLKKEEAFNSAEHNWNLFYLKNNDPILEPVKMGSIKFVDDIPTYFKYYKYVPR